jgi:hypothetical protein
MRKKRPAKGEEGLYRACSRRSSTKSRERSENNLCEEKSKISKKEQAAEKRGPPRVEQGQRSFAEVNQLSCQWERESPYGGEKEEQRERKCDSSGGRAEEGEEGADSSDPNCHQME